VSEVWIVERRDRNSDDAEPLGFTADPKVAAEYTARLNALLSRESRAHCYPMPLLATSPEPFIGFSMVYEVSADGRAERTANHANLILAQDAPFAESFLPEPHVRVWEPGQDGTASGRDVWRVVGHGRDSGQLEHACRLDVLKILERGRTEEGHWHAVNEHDCPECGSPAMSGCRFGDAREMAIGFHLARVEAMKVEARRRAAIWSRREMPLWIEVTDPHARWWEVGERSYTA
jgi:hypothetical protein